MRRFIFCAAWLIAAYAQSQPAAQITAAAEVRSSRGSVSPSAPINLNYRVESGNSGQLQRVNIAIDTRLNSGTLLVEVAKQEGVAVIGETTQRIDLTTAKHPIALTLQATQLGEGEHYLVLLLTVETEMGPMSRSFRIDLTPTLSDATL